MREGWNPPNYPPHEFGGNVNDYVRLRAVGYAAVKAADPRAVVVGPASAQTTGFGSQYVGAVHWFMGSWPEFVNGGGLYSLDVISFTHYYAVSNWHVPGFEVPTFILGMVDSGRGGKPIWTTETGWSGNPATSQEEKGRSLIRLAFIFWSTPWVERFSWYDSQEQSLVPSRNHRGLMQTTSGGAPQASSPTRSFTPPFASWS